MPSLKLKPRFNDVFATLRAIREEIDRRKLNPSGSQLEYKFQEFKDKGITINAVADGREFAFYENKFMRETLDTASKPEKTTDPASTDGESATSSTSSAPVEESAETPESSPVIPNSKL